MEVKRQRGVEKTSKGRKEGEQLFGKFLLGKCASATEAQARPAASCVYSHIKLFLDTVVHCVI